MGTLWDTYVSRKVPNLTDIPLKSVWDIKRNFKVDRVSYIAVHVSYMLHNILTWAQNIYLEYSSYFYRQLLRRFLILFCFVFPLEWPSTSYFWYRWKGGTQKEQSYTEMKHDSKILCNSFFWYCSSFRCSLSLFFTLCFWSEHRETLRKQTISLNAFSLFHLKKFVPLNYSTNATGKSPGA